MSEMIKTGTLAEIKQHLGYAALNLNTAFDKDDKPTDWMRHWDNDNRVAVSIHKETVTKLKAEGGALLNLGLQTEKREGDKGEYTAMRIVQFTPAEEVL